MKSNNNFHILIVDDEKLNIELAAVYLKEEGYKLSFSLSAKSAFELISQKKIDLILLDINMPVMDGFSMCKMLKNDPQTKDIPVIFLTAQTSIEYISEAFSVGGIDYITKPFNGEELKMRVKTHLQNLAFLEEIKHKQTKLAQLSITDNLTKLKNSLYFDAQMRSFQKADENFWIVYIKINRLEKLNELYGFYGTNKILRKFAKVLENATYSNAITAHLFGADFAVLLRDYDKDSIIKLYKTINENLVREKDIAEVVKTSTVLYNVKNSALEIPKIYRNIHKGLHHLREETNAKYLFL